MNIIYLERQLRAGKTPEQLGGEVIGKGVSKVAYLVPTASGGIVVKEDIANGFASEAKSAPPKAIAKYGARMVRQYRAGKYALQEPVTVLYDRSRDMWNCTEEIREQWQTMYSALQHDMHQCNCGTDSRGRLVVFDW